MPTKTEFQVNEASVRGNPATELEDIGTTAHSSGGAAKAPGAPIAHQDAGSGLQQSAAASAPAPAFAISSFAGLEGKTSADTAATNSGQPLSNTTLNQVIESADTMRSDGKTHVELQLKLDDGQLITVRLQMSQGSIHPIFKTESPELRQAIEQNWAGFRSGASERGLDIAAPVFESPSSGGGFGAFGNRDQSRQSAGDPNSSETESRETFSQPGLRPGKKQSATQPSAASPMGSGVQLYA